VFADSGSEQNNRSKRQRRKNKVTVTQNDNSADEENSDATSAAEYTDTPDTSSNNATMSFDDDFPFQTNGKGWEAALLIPIICYCNGHRSSNVYCLYSFLLQV
jgi:hypothetical protein